MFEALVLLRNLESGAERLDFGAFTVQPIGLQFETLREVFSSVDVNQADWLLNKSYTVPPPAPPGSPLGGILNDIEDILLLFRLYKVGDIAFVKRAIIPAGAKSVVQFPYRAMNDLNSYSPLRFEFRPDECESWIAFAEGIRKSRSWDSEWFAVARRFFLNGGAEEFNPRWGDVDRILDYATALQAAVAPEMDFARRRISVRSAMLISSDPAEQSTIVALVKQLYDIRSSIVHGSKLSDEKRVWLIENCSQIELRVRQVLVAALQSVPAEGAERSKILAALYDPSDGDRGESALQKFREIRTDVVRKGIGEKIRLLSD